jgi:hypothetical protein
VPARSAAGILASGVDLGAGAAYIEKLFNKPPTGRSHEGPEQCEADL